MIKGLNLATGAAETLEGVIADNTDHILGSARGRTDHLSLTGGSYDVLMKDLEVGITLPNPYPGLSRWTYTGINLNGFVGKGTYRGPAAPGYLWMHGMYRSGLAAGGSPVYQTMLTFMKDAQDAFKAQFPAAIKGPFMPKYGMAGWEAISTSGVVGGSPVSNVLNQFYFASSDDTWYGYQFRAMLSMAHYYYLTGSATAKAILDNWMTWLDASDASGDTVHVGIRPKNAALGYGTGWTLPSNFNSNGTFTYGYQPTYAHSCIAAACIYKYWVDGDALALKWYRRLLDDMHNNVKITATGYVAGFMVDDEGAGYAAPSVTGTDANGAAFSGTATVAGGKITHVAVNAAGSGLVAPLTVQVTDATGTGAVIRAYLINDLHGAYSKQHAGWEVSEHGNTLGMLINGRPGGTVNFPLSATANDLQDFIDLHAFIVRNPSDLGPSMLNADMIPVHEFVRQSSWHWNSGIENPAERDTHSPGTLWTETTAPMLFFFAEWAKYSGDFTMVDTLYDFLNEMMGVVTTKKRLDPSPYPAIGGLLQAQMDITGQGWHESSLRGNLDSSVFTVTGNTITIPANKGGGNVTWVRGAWKTPVLFRYQGFMADIDPGYVGDTTNYCDTAAIPAPTIVNQPTQTVLPISPGLANGTQLQVFYSHRAGKIGKGQAIGGWPQLHRCMDVLDYGTANDGDLYMGDSLYHLYDLTGNAKYKTMADKILQAQIDWSTPQGNKLEFDIPYAAEQSAGGIYEYSGNTATLALSGVPRPDATPGGTLRVKARVPGAPAYGYAGFGTWPVWPIGAPPNDFSNIKFKIWGDGSGRLIQLSTNISPTHLDSETLYYAFPCLSKDARTLRQFTIVPKDLWKVNNVAFNGERQSWLYNGVFNGIGATAALSTEEVDDTALDGSHQFFVQRMDWDYSNAAAPQQYAGFYFGNKTAVVSTGTTGLVFNLYSSAIGTVDFTVTDALAVNYSVLAQPVVAGWQAITIPWATFGALTHPISQFKIQPKWATGHMKLNNVSYGAIVTMADLAPTLINGMQFALNYGTMPLPGAAQGAAFFGEKALMVANGALYEMTIN